MSNIRVIADDPCRKTVRDKYFKMPHIVSKTAVTVYMCLKDTNNEALGRLLRPLLRGIIAYKGRKLSKRRIDYPDKILTRTSNRL